MTAAHDVEPRFRAPPLSCDAHFHVFGPAGRYPHGGVNEKLRYTPPLAPLEDYLAHARPLGFERFEIHVNNRLVLNGLLASLGLGDKAVALLPVGSVGERHYQAISRHDRSDIPCRENGDHTGQG